MNPPRPRCILLTDHRPGRAQAAEALARRFLDVRHVSAYPRDARTLAPEVETIAGQGEIDYLLNFLSPVIVPERILRNIRRQSINFHPAPPKWPGVGSASFALYEEDQEFGATAHLMAAKVDSGPILQVRMFPIAAEDTCQSLFDRALDESLHLFGDVVRAIHHAGDLKPNGLAWQRPAISRRAFERWMTISPADPVQQIHRKVRALRHPTLPGPFLDLAGYRFALPPASPDFSGERKKGAA